MDILNDDLYHPRYPSIDHDYQERLMELARCLMRAKELGIEFLCCNREHKVLVEYNPPRKWVKT